MVGWEAGLRRSAGGSPRIHSPTRARQAGQHKLAMGGALVDPVDSALLIFRNCTKEVTVGVRGVRLLLHARGV